MAMSGGGRGRTVMSDINVTPLVDVMLVLLVIFMVTAPMIQQGAKVDLPNTETVEIEPDDQKSVLVIDREGVITLAGAAIPIEELEDKIRANEKIKREGELYLHADENLPYKLVARVLVILRKAGVKNLGMVTEPLGSDG